MKVDEIDEKPRVDKDALKVRTEARPPHNDNDAKDASRPRRAKQEMDTSRSTVPAPTQPSPDRPADSWEVAVSRPLIRAVDIFRMRWLTCVSFR
jgi:hypothetical protein